MFEKEELQNISEYIERLKAVKVEEIVAAAKRMQLDTVYFLKGEDK